MEKNNLILTITIGSQVWTSKNLDVSTYRNGDIIPQVQDPNAWAELTTGAWCYYDNDSSNGTKHGKLYNWYAVNDPRGLAPDGYHIPTDAEWKILIDFLGGKDVAGKKMKSTSGWEHDYIYDISGNGNNSSGFAGLPGGFRDEAGTCDFLGYYGYWWSSTEFYKDLSEACSLQSDKDRVRRETPINSQGLSVRCLCDHALNQQTEVLKTGAESLSNMDLGESGGGMNPAGMMNNMGQNMNQQQNTPPPPPPTIAYSVSVNGQTAGPFNLQQLQQMVQNGQLTQNTHVWKQGMAGWEIAGNVQELSNLFGAVPPPPPPPPVV